MAVQADGGIGEAQLGLVERQASVAQPEIPVWLMRRVGHQPQVGQLAAGGEARHSLLAKDKVRRQHVAGDHPEHFGQPGQSPCNATSGFKRTAKIQPFVRIDDAAARSRARPARQLELRAKVIADLLAQPCCVDQQAGQAGPGQCFHGPLHQRLALNCEQRFGPVVAERAHALAAPCGQNHGASGQSVVKRLHCAIVPTPAAAPLN